MNWEAVVLKANSKKKSVTEKIFKTEDEWRELLPPDVFQITRKKGTERPFSSQVCNSFEPGIYVCACCSTPLFSAEEKFDSGTGWPSFTKPLEDKVIGYHADNSYGQYRVEVCCDVCHSHLGHVFPDGPKPSRLRFCINALALKK